MVFERKLPPQTQLFSIKITVNKKVKHYIGKYVLPWGRGFKWFWCGSSACFVLVFLFLDLAIYRVRLVFFLLLCRPIQILSLHLELKMPEYIERSVNMLLLILYPRKKNLWQQNVICCLLENCYGKVKVM